MNALEKYESRVAAVDSLVCVGLDPDIGRLPARFRAAAQPQFAFCKYLIGATHASTASYKLNIAFFEARGAQGFEELKLVTDYLRAEHPGILLLCDGKRSDTDNTNAQYATAVFDWFGFDGATVHPYMGGDALAPVLERHDKAVIVLCLNIGGHRFQTLPMADGRPLWQAVATLVCREWNKAGNCMLVVGATCAADMRMARALAGDMTFLVPGVGAQGGDLDVAVREGLNSRGAGLIIVAARSVIFAEDPARAAADLRDRINAQRRSAFSQKSRSG